MVDVSGGDVIVGIDEKQEPAFGFMHASVAGVRHTMVGSGDEVDA